jgi:uncharacterized delta-60 repeat protein
MSKLKSIIKLPLVLLAMVFFRTIANGQAGVVDTSYYQGMGVDFKCTGGLVQPDSSVIIIGRFAYVNNRAINCIAKLNRWGENDYSFNIGSGADEHINQVVRQPDGKLIIAGDFNKFNGDSVFHICRLNPDGSRDMSFNTGTGFSTAGTVYALTLQPDGKIMAGGIFITYNGATANYIVRLNADGTRDTTFNSGLGFNNTVYDIDRQADGKYIVSGNFTSFNGDTTIKRIVRLTATGAVDPLFNSGAGFNNIVTRTAIQPNGKIVAVGFFTNYNGTARNRIVRINSDGSLDATLNVGTGFNSNVNDLALQEDGKILATGNYTTYKGVTTNRIIRIDTLGGKDATFAVGTGLNASCNAVFLGMDSTVFVGGTFTLADSFTRLRLVKYLTNGKPDQTFLRESKVNSQILASATQANGQAVIVGSFTRYNERMANRIARLNSDGTVDSTFASGTGANATIRTIYILADNKILIGGDFTSYDGKTVNRIARLNANGSLDTTFVTGTGANNIVYAITVDAQGKIYVGGNFTVYNADSVYRIMRLNANGSRDAGFAMGSGFNNYVYKIVLQPDGKILACGAFTNYMGVAANRVIRLNTTGSQDATFTGSGANNIVYAIELVGNGDILVGGAFTSFNGSATKRRIALLNSTGALKTFAATVANGIVYDIKKVNKGYLASGTFTSFNGVSRGRLAYIDSAGATSNTFFTGTGANSTVSSLYIDTIFKTVYYSGAYNALQGALYNGFARVRLSNIRLLPVSTDLCPGAILTVYFEKTGVYLPGNIFTVQLSDSNGNFTNALNIAAKNSSSTGLDSVTAYFPGNLPFGSNYRIRVLSSLQEDISNLSLAITVGTPKPPVVTPLGPLGFCGGDSVKLQASQGSAYTWSNGATTQTITVNATGSYTVTVNNSNCIASSNPIVTSVLPAPDSTIYLAAASLCNGGSVRLSGAPGLTYAWNLGPTTQSITINQDDTYALTVTDTSGCKSSSSINLVLADYFSNLIKANGPTTFCQGGNVVLSSLNGLNGYNWSNGETTPTITVTTSGSYTVTITDGICSLTSTSLQVTVLPAPTVSFNLPQDTFCQNAGTITLGASPSGGTFAGMGLTGNTFNPAGLVDSTVVVSYTYTGGNSCSTTIIDTATVVVCTGVNNLSNVLVRVFPNPTSQYLFIENLPAENCTVEIFDVVGNRVIQKQLQNASKTETIPVMNLAQGQYILTVNGTNSRFTKID